MNDNSQNIAKTIYAALNEASQITMLYFRKPVFVETKPDDSPVSIADRETEAAIAIPT